MRHSQQNRRSRGRNNNNNNNNNSGNRKGQNPLTRSFESNGPDVKIRGTPSHIAEKYVAMARDALSSGDPVLAENYLQHAEHYNRIIMTYREQQGPQHGDHMQGGHNTIGRHRNPGDPIDDDPIEDAGADEQGAEAAPPRGNEPQPSMRSHDRDDRSQRRSHPRRDRDRDRDRDRGADRGGERDAGPERERTHERSSGDRDRGSERVERSPEPRSTERRSPEPRSAEPRSAEPRPERGGDTDRSPASPRVADQQPAPVRAPRSSSRRARYVETDDQPEFLKRPVRRPSSKSDDADTANPAKSDEAAE